MSGKDNPYTLIEAEDSVLVVIDVQDAFLDKLPVLKSERLLDRICWLVKLARWKGVPLVVTAEEAETQPITSRLHEVLLPETPILDKLVFGLADQPDTLRALKQTGRKTAVLVGLETDVCVMQSAMGLLDDGYRVAVVADATGTPAPGQEIGIERMRAGGAIITNMKGLFYEWLRTVEEVKRFHAENPEMRGLAGTML